MMIIFFYVLKDINRLIIFLDYNIVELEYCTRVLFNEEKWFKIGNLYHCNCLLR